MVAMNLYFLFFEIVNGNMIALQTNVKMFNVPICSYILYYQKFSTFTHLQCISKKLDLQLAYFIQNRVQPRNQAHDNSGKRTFQCSHG